MTRETIKKEDYTITFWATGVSVLYTDMVNTMYLRYDPLCCIYKDKYFQYLRKDKFELAGKDGIALLSNKKGYQKYIRDLKKTRADFEKFCRHLTEKDAPVTKQSLQTFLDYAAKLHRGYSKMNFEHTDKAFLLKDKNKILAQNLESMAKFKDVVRTTINDIFFEKNGPLNVLLDNLGRKFGLPRATLLNYTQQELLDLFDGRKVPGSVLQARSKGFAVQSIHGHTKYYAGNAVASIVKQLAQPVSKNQTILKGMVANKGMASGRVKIIHNDFSDFSKLRREIQKMKKGQILVAEMTAPELILACKKASAIITDQGGLMSHAAIVSRELNIPCIVGTKVATQILKDGGRIAVNAYTGIVKKL